MEKNLEGQERRLPGGDRVRIKTVYPDGKASAVRLDGDFEGLIVLCRIENLEPLPENMDSLSGSVI